MQWSDIPFSPHSTKLRQFAALWLVFFVGVAGWLKFARSDSGSAAIYLLIGVIIGVAGLARPQVIRPIFVGWMILAFPIGWLVSIVLLSLVYFGLILPTGLISRIAGRDPLHLRSDSKAATYWTPTPASTDVRRYFRPY